MQRAKRRTRGPTYTKCAAVDDELVLKWRAESKRSRQRMMAVPNVLLPSLPSHFMASTERRRVESVSAVCLRKDCRSGLCLPRRRRISRQCAQLWGSSHGPDVAYGTGPNCLRFENACLSGLSLLAAEKGASFEEHVSLQSAQPWGIAHPRGEACGSGANCLRFVKDCRSGLSLLATEKGASLCDQRGLPST